MFEIALAQQRRVLWDPSAEGAVRDRISLWRFCGVPPNEETPICTTVGATRL
jgi:IS5 family transposase